MRERKAIIVAIRVNFLSQFYRAKYPDFSTQLAAKNPFEKAVAKKCQEMPLDSVDKQQLEKFKKCLIALPGSSAQVSFADEVLANKKMRYDNNIINLEWLPPTSNRAERLFSIVRHVFTVYRKSLHPHHLENQIFLAVNSEFWDATTVAQAKN